MKRTSLENYKYSYSTSKYPNDDGSLNFAYNSWKKKDKKEEEAPPDVWLHWSIKGH